MLHQVVASEQLRLRFNMPFYVMRACSIMVAGEQDRR